MLSRNFRLQRAGNVSWLLKNYNFKNVAHAIDELVVIDVSRDQQDRLAFVKDVAQIAENCFIPITLGGGIDDFETAATFIANGADKVIVNSLFERDATAVQKIAEHFGRQCVVGGLDLVKTSEGALRVASQYNHGFIETPPDARLATMLDIGVGEILLQSIEQDGTGNGFDFDTISAIGGSPEVPLIICGGCGKGEHMIRALERKDVDAVATANLFNFIGDGLQKARDQVFSRGIDIPMHNKSDFEMLQH